MKKIKTDSYFVTIYKTKNKKFIRRRKRKGLHAYPRTLSLKEINMYLKNSKIRYPKLLRNGFNFISEEFIESTKSIEKLSNLEIENEIMDIIFELNKIDIKNPKKLNQYISELEKLYKNLDNDRKLCLIHGDIHRKNIIIHNNNFYLIDWELATYGDLAYELATYFILMEYTNEEKEKFLIKLNQKLKLNLNNLKNDIEEYIVFELYRRKVLKEIN